MKPFVISALAVLLFSTAGAQQRLTPEKLWQLGRVSGIGLSKDRQLLVYSVGIPDKKENRIVRKTYLMATSGGESMPLTQPMDSVMTNRMVSPNGKYLVFTRETPVMKVTGAELYPDLPKANVYVYNSLNYRHWDTWEDGKFDHVYVAQLVNGHPAPATDIMANEPYDCPQKPFGGDEDIVWSPDSKRIVYTAKKKFGTDYAVSTNTDLFEYSLETRTTKNLTEDNKGYDINPSFSKAGVLAWLQMKRDGYESDKQDIIISDGRTKTNLTAQRDDIHVESYLWSNSGESIYFIAPINGTLQLFKVTNPFVTKTTAVITQVTSGDFDISAIVGLHDDAVFLARNDMNHATELFRYTLNNAKFTQLTRVNDTAYARLGICRTERRFVTTTDNQKMLVWVILPPGFDATKKYPTLLFCQGGPQSPLTQSYSFRWNFQLMASQGYIVVAPARRGMPGFGTAWNEQVSKDWGGQVLKDYLSAIDAVSKETYVDKNRLGCIGASFGGYSAFALEGMHEGRFKTFIAHDGIFDFRSMYGTTDELFFENWEKGGNYWDKNNAAAQRSFGQSPSNFVDKWNTPILIVQGGRDYRVPIEQGQQAFQAAQLKGIKSRFLYLPDENHWVLSQQNALVWQREFFKWLEETLK
ncbi:S9 family peptidase [Sediminibacterium soli]|uniref:S9 family peptidase n=1 Tax=Sediminibacterium soli TaxID=2698829 RepID=UPI00137A90A0|nr:prolyl oligopeptidase family serine peptidase [Sediminibacterium soli]NCI46357.1 S9 family peptidase [Sediminibacterium soli]